MNEIPLASKIIAYGFLVVIILFIAGITYYVIAGG